MCVCVCVCVCLSVCLSVCVSLCYHSSRNIAHYYLTSAPHYTIIFSQFYRREVIGHYVKYVNNFTDAMGTLQKNISKRPKFVSFLKEKYKESKTSLSLQGLLLKPVQRFPQYILFLQVLFSSMYITSRPHTFPHFSFRRMCASTRQVYYI